MASSRGLLRVINNHLFKSYSRFSKVVSLPKLKNLIRNCSTTSIGSSLHPPDVPALTETARISLTTAEVLSFKVWSPQLEQIWRVTNFGEDIIEIFENRDALISSVPSYADPYIKVPKVLNKE